MEHEEAIKKIKDYLSKMELDINSIGSAIPDYIDPNIQLEIVHKNTEEYDFGWVFYYNSAKYLETGNIVEALAGNAPLILDRCSGQIHETGTVRDTSYYVNNFINTGDPNIEAASPPNKSFKSDAASGAA